MATQGKPNEGAAQRESTAGALRAPVPYRRADADPFFPLRTRFDQLFEQLFRGWAAPWEASEWHWGMDVEETDDAVVVQADAPGFEPDDFDLQVRGDQLVLRASHKAKTEEKEKGRHEWRQQELYRAMTLPPGVDADKVEAHYRNGVLTVTLPRTEQSKGRRITVQQ